MAGMNTFSTQEIAELVETRGVAKARAPAVTTFVLGVVAGAFIALGVVLSTVIGTGSELGFGPTRYLSGIGFSLGLVLVIVAGAGLFHREQPHCHELGERPHPDWSAPPELGHRLRGNIIVGVDASASAADAGRQLRAPVDHKTLDHGNTTSSSKRISASNISASEIIVSVGGTPLATL
jgi:hypothetical protein